MNPTAACRSCGASDLHEFLDLGRLPMVNAFPDAAAPAAEVLHHVEVASCPSCCLVQLRRGPPPGDVFNESYPYFSSFSDTLLAHSEAHARLAVDALALDAASRVVEVGSNDGYLLQHFAKQGIEVLGVDPSAGPAEAARAVGVPTVEGFFDEDLAGALRREAGPADLIVANNVLAHVPDPNRLMAAMGRLVADGGSIHIENPSVRDLVDRTAFDTIYQEHYSYLSTTAVASLAHRHGLRLLDVDYFRDLHGGTLRWSLGREGTPDPAVARSLEDEQRWGIRDPATFDRFAERVQCRVRELQDLLSELRRTGARIAGYGAAAKAAVLANVCGITPDLVEFVVDRNPHKQGRFMPGTHQPILAPSAVDRRDISHLLVFVWNQLPEVREVNRAFIERGGRFIVPVPRPEIVA